MIKIPYGVRDFEKLIEENFWYLDRTDRIRVFEEFGYELLFLRPRRFGKSLWLSTLMNYYDINKAKDFERLFGHLAIGKNPTALRNQYLVLKWDFSNIESQGTVREIRTSLYNHINSRINNFQYFNEAHLNRGVEINPDDALASFESLLGVIRSSGHKLYLFIDEYDNFANEVMMATQRGLADENQQRYRDLVAGDGLLKTLFKNLKSAGSGEGLDRVFMTGVSPIVMSDMTSGANTVKDVTWHPYLFDLCGFSDAEVRSLVTPILNECALPESKIDEVMEQIRIFYNGSRFVTRHPRRSADESLKVYNPTLTFYFLEEFRTFCSYPETMLDQNLAPDYNRLVYISSHPAGEQLLYDALNETNTVSISTLQERFGLAEMLQGDKQYERLAALLCYLGAFTVAGTTSDATIALDIPNQVMRKLYAERILEMIFPAAAERDLAQNAARRLFAQGDIQPLCDFVAQYYLAVFDNRDYKHFNELTLKTLFMALLHHTNLYMMDSEPALKRSYADLLLLIRPEMRHYKVFDLLFEFKYLPLDKVGQGKKAISGEELRKRTSEEIAAQPAIRQKLDEARAQLQSYQQTLQQKYGTNLKLRSFAVVAIGMERLVWEEVDHQT